MMKSALDLAMEASNANQGKNGHPCTMIFRSAHWMRPDNRTFSLIMSYLYATRFSELMIPKPEQGLLLSIISTFLTPMRWGISKFVEMFLLYSLPLRQFGLVPEETFFEQYASCQLPAIPESFFERVQEGHIKLCKTRNWGFFENGIVLEDGRQIEADVVILGTGYDGEKKLMSLLQKTEYTKLQNSEGGIPLYRGLIHPHIQNLAIMGFNEALSNLYASEMGARWLAHLLSGKFTLPSIEIMEKMSQKWNEYIKNATPFHQRSCIGAISIWYSDQVCHDLGWNPRRKRNIFQELFAPYSNMDYRD
ncbi:hypothetical protein KP509_23G070500 [Ceratopteris richardii]|nr:hypothetical protein KP509_23G070500 [Ceratopteris richardii]